MSTMSDPRDQFKSLLGGSGFIFLVFFRGHWCPFCMSYLKQLQALTGDIAAAGGSTLIVTAEVEEHMAATRATTGYQGQAISDPENILAKELKKRGLLDVAISDKGGYKHGMAQPAILVMKNGGPILYNWAIVPSLMNLGGAKDRPSLKEIWEDSEAKLQGKQVAQRKYSKQSFVSVIKEKVFG